MATLELVSIDDIWEELKNRFDGVILTTLKSRNDKTEERQVSYCGGKFTCIGLAEFTKNKLLESCKDEER